MSSDVNVKAAIVPPAKRSPVSAFGDSIEVFLSGDDTGGKYTMFLDIAPPGGGPPPHYHKNEDEIFHVVEGRASFFYDGKWTEVPVGTTVYMAKHTVHAFKNIGDTPLKLLITTSPAGMETFFQRCAGEFARAGGPNMDNIMKISAEHGIHFVV
jgi:quercetin dioxygenase-like cupin family protein